MSRTAELDYHFAFVMERLEPHVDICEGNRADPRWNLRCLLKLWELSEFFKANKLASTLSDSFSLFIFSCKHEQQHQQVHANILKCFVVVINSGYQEFMCFDIKWKRKPSKSLKHGTITHNNMLRHSAGSYLFLKFPESCRRHENICKVFGLEVGNNKFR